MTDKALLKKVALASNAQQAIACQRFKTPLTRRALWFVCDWGWAVVLAAVFLLAGCDDLTVAQAVAQEATEAPALAQMQARAEFIEIAGVKR